MPSDRFSNIKALQQDTFDLLIIGGGAMGAGTALDASMRGLKVALIEKEDFASGASSHSTKLLHGGIRYLERLISRLDWEQYQVIRDSLEERKRLLELAPHLTRQLPLLIPVYSWKSALYYYLGVKMYGFLAWDKDFPPSKWVSASEARKIFPLLNQKDLKGGVLFFDAQFDDIRLNMSLILSAKHHGATIANYTKLVGFNKVEGKIKEAIAYDKQTQNKFRIKARAIVNTSGAAIDTIRKMDDETLLPLIEASQGTHLVVEKELTGSDVGLLIPKTQDNRVLFLLPWQGKSLLGTTDISSSPISSPRPSNEEKEYLLAHLNNYLEKKTTLKDVKASWAGMRSLMKKEKSENTAAIPRSYWIEERDSGLYSLVGGKWTTYRKIAETLTDTVILSEKFTQAQACTTKHTPIFGGEGFNRDQLLSRLQNFDQDIKDHLIQSYGNQALLVASLAHNGLEDRLTTRFPYILAEVLYATKFEFVLSPQDLLLRRIHLGLLDSAAAIAALPNVVDVMGDELGWNRQKRQEELDTARLVLMNDPPLVFKQDNVV